VTPDQPQAEPPESGAERPQNESTRGDWSKNPYVIFGTLAISVAAMLVSLYGAYLSNRSAEEEREVSIEGLAVANQLRRTETGLGISVSLSNASLRPVIIRGASLWFDGKQLGTARGYVADAVVLDRIQEDPGRVVDQTRQLPFTLDVRQGRTVGIFVFDDELYVNAAAANNEKRERQAQRVIRRWRRVLTGLDQPKGHQIELRLRLLPGGTQTFPVQVEPAMTALFAWQLSVTPLGRKGVSLGLRRKAGEPGQTSVVSLDVWARDGGYHKAFERPLIGADFTYVPIRGLRRGIYWFAFRLGAKAVASGCFRVPARPFDDRPCFDVR
jgi:hypothetical protein